MAKQDKPPARARAFVQVNPGTPALAAGVAVLLPNGVRLNVPSLDATVLSLLAQL